jgi:hypothetical protein
MHIMYTFTHLPCIGVAGVQCCTSLEILTRDIILPTVTVHDNSHVAKCPCVEGVDLQAPDGNMNSATMAIRLILFFNGPSTMTLTFHARTLLGFTSTHGIGKNQAITATPTSSAFLQQPPLVFALP